MPGRWLAPAIVAALLGGSALLPAVREAVGAGRPCCTAGHSCPLARAALRAGSCALHQPSARAGQGRHDVPCSVSPGCRHSLASLPADGREGLPPSAAAAPAPAWAGRLAPAAPPLLLGSRPSPDSPPPRPRTA